jgi:hypothetical protein
LKVERGSVPFDEKLQVAIDANPSLSKVVRAFNAHGWIAGAGTLEKQVPRGDVSKSFDIDLVDITMRHNKFPYTIEGVKGKIKSLNKSFSFEQLTGGNGIGKILCNGRWTRKKDSRQGTFATTSNLISACEPRSKLNSRKFGTDSDHAEPSK